MSIEIGSRLQTVRKHFELSQRELAKRSGVTNATISLIEQNKVSPSVSSLKKVLDGLPMSLADFFTFEAEANTRQIFFEKSEQPDVGSGDIHFHLILCLVVCLSWCNFALLVLILQLLYLMFGFIFRF